MSDTHILKIKDLEAKVASENLDILNGLNLDISGGEIHAIMGPNGSGKSTLAHVISGRELYEIGKGEILFKDKNLIEMDPEERALEGVFMSYQYPAVIPGVNLAYFLKIQTSCDLVQKNYLRKINYC